MLLLSPDGICLFAEIDEDQTILFRNNIELKEGVLSFITVPFNMLEKEKTCIKWCISFAFQTEWTISGYISLSWLVFF